MNQNLIYILPFIFIAVLCEVFRQYHKPIKLEKVNLTGTLLLNKSIRGFGYFWLTNPNGEKFYVYMPLELAVGKGKDETVSISFEKLTYRSGQEDYVYLFEGENI